jgi:hypothetical protein
MSASEQALIDQGDHWLEIATGHGSWPQSDRQHAATLACAYFLRAGILARQEAMQRARTEAQHVAETIRQRQQANTKGQAE